MTTPRPTVAQSLKRLEREVLTWPGVHAERHRFGGTEFRLPRGEIGHIHAGGLVDVPFPRALRDDLIARGKAWPHHVLPHSGWVSYRVRGEADLPGALELLRLNYERRAHQLGAPEERRSEREELPPPPAPLEPEFDDPLDEALAETFPASDVPEVHRD